jgi:hypothetical protein
MQTSSVLVAAATLLTSSAALAAPCHNDSGADARRPECTEREIYLMPGVQGVVFAPVAPGVLPFVGAGVHFAPFQWSHNTDSFGPSQGAVFIQGSFLRSASSNATMAFFEAGTTLSFERNSGRQFMIPYFGSTFGGLTHAELPDSVYVFPLLGLHALYHPNLMLDLDGGARPSWRAHRAVLALVIARSPPDFPTTPARATKKACIDACLLGW